MGICKRRLEAFTEAVLGRFNPSFLRARTCAAFFGSGRERRKFAKRAWQVSSSSEKYGNEVILLDRSLITHYLVNLDPRKHLRNMQYLWNKF